MVREFNSQQAHVQWNDDMAHKYDPEDYHLRSNFFIRWIEKRRVRSILHLLEVSVDDKILEVGCGAGNVLEQVSSTKLVGIDLSSYLLDKSQRRLNRVGALLVQADGECLPFHSCRFSRVYCTEVLEHVINPRFVVQEMARVVKSDGIIVISIPNEALIDRIKSIFRKLPLHHILFSARENVYRIPESMTDEWHLHHFNLAYLQNVVNGIISINTVRPIPFAALPIRYVIQGQVL